MKGLIMVMQRKIKMAHEDVFPQGAFLKGVVEPISEFDPALKRADGTRPQATDKESGLLLWQALSIDADMEAGKKDTVVSVKFAATHQPVPPENKSGLPWTPVEFVGLTATAWIDEKGNRPRLEWSYRAESMKAPSETPWPNTDRTTAASVSGSSGKAAG